MKAVLYKGAVYIPYATSSDEVEVAEEMLFSRIASSKRRTRCRCGRAQGLKSLTTTKLNPTLGVLEVSITQKVINALGPKFSSDWGQFANIHKLQFGAMKAMKSSKTPREVIPDLVILTKAVQDAKAKGITKFIFYKLWTTSSHESQCERVHIINHEKFHAFCDVLRGRHRLFKGKPQGLMRDVVERCKLALQGHISGTTEDAVAKAMKAMPSEVGAKRRKWVSLVDVNLMRLQKLMPKDVAASYEQGTSLPFFIEEILADLSGYDSVKTMECEGYYSNYSEEGIEKVIQMGFSLKRAIKELLNTKAAAKVLVDYITSHPQSVA